MSNLVFPNYPGLAYGIHRKPLWKTKVQESASGNEIAIGYMSYPRYQWRMDFAVLRSTLALPELAGLQGFFNQLRGRVDTFLFTDPEDNSATNQNIGTGNGSNKAFQLKRALGGFTEPVTAPNGAQVIKVAGVTKTAGTDYSIGPTGIVLFGVAPANGTAVTWSGPFYYRCRFLKDDALDLVLQYLNIWEAKGVEFRSVKG